MCGGFSHSFTDMLISDHRSGIFSFVFLSSSICTQLFFFTSIVVHQSVEELKQLRQHQQLASQSGVYPALSATCFHVCLASDLADMMQKKDGTLSGDESRDMEILLADEYNTEREELLQRGKERLSFINISKKDTCPGNS